MVDHFLESGSDSRCWRKDEYKRGQRSSNWCRRCRGRSRVCDCNRTESLARRQAISAHSATKRALASQELGVFPQG
jgi:hypothetical protein